MRVVLADLKGADGFVHKDTVVGGYGARLRPLSRVTSLAAALRRRLNDVPSITMGYLAAILARAGHDVAFTRDRRARRRRRPRPVVSRRPSPRGGVGRSSARAGHARRLRRPRGVQAARALRRSRRLHRLRRAGGGGRARLAAGEAMRGIVHSRELADLDALPFPRWDLLGAPRPALGLGSRGRGPLGGLPVLASRSCPEFCTYCPHRILSGYRARVGGEHRRRSWRCSAGCAPSPFVIFRDPLFTHDRDRCLELARRDRSTAACGCASSARRASTASTTSCWSALQGAGLREHHVRRGVARAGDPAQGGPPARSREEQQRRVDRRPAIAWASAPSASTCSACPPTPGSPSPPPSSSRSASARRSRSTSCSPSTRARRSGSSSAPRSTSRTGSASTASPRPSSHPTLSARELQFLLTAAWSRFYLRPSFFAKLWRLDPNWAHRLAGRLDGAVSGLHARQEAALMSRPVAC